MSLLAIPIPRNRRFTGRKDTLKSLEKKLFESMPSTPVAIVGLGGVGKTQVALELAYSNDYRCSVFWLSASSYASFEKSYANVATQLRLDVRSKSPKDAVLRYLESGGLRTCLLILDHADDLNILFKGSIEQKLILDYLPKHSSCRILLTTRSREIATSIAGPDFFDLAEMSHAEARELLGASMAMMAAGDDEAVIGDFLNEVECLPLAIVQAAAYMQTHRSSLKHYLSFLRGTPNDVEGLLSRTFRDSADFPVVEKSVTGTWEESFDQIDRFHSEAKPVLQYASWLKHKAIPRAMLGRKTEEMEHAIGVLCGYGFLVRREDDMFDMPRLVHVSARKWLPDKIGDDSWNGVRTGFIEHLCSLFPSDHQTNRQVWRKYLPHALYVLEGSKNRTMMKRRLKGVEFKEIKERDELSAFVEKFVYADAEGRIKEVSRTLEKPCSVHSNPDNQEGTEDELMVVEKETL